jgi:DNA (cytosine-5)-methyltransferase 1
VTAFYNENDPKAAAWLRELIKGGHIADGVVDERSIEDVLPNDLKDFTQCHFFAGIGGWSYALRLAGWPDERPVWTGSCPCQPFSAAGKGGGFADERHLWPAWHWLIKQCRPSIIFGEQVASKDGLNWFDAVSADLEDSGYTCAASDLCAAGIGAPHIRQRLYWTGYSGSARTRRDTGTVLTAQKECRCQRLANGDLPFPCQCAGATCDNRLEHAESDGRLERGSEPSRGSVEPRRGPSGTVVNANNEGPQGRGERRDSAYQRAPWAASLVDCRDGKRRPVEPGTFPLAHGIPGRVGLLRGYGNAIVPQVAAAFVMSAMEATP